MRGEGDIEVMVSHLAPAILAGRRGSASVAAAIRMRTPAVVRRVERSAFTTHMFPMPVRNEVRHEFEGRFWRRVSCDAPGPGSVVNDRVGTDALRSALSGEDVLKARPDLGYLTLDAWHTTGTYGHLKPHPRILDDLATDPSRLAMDLRPEAAAAIAVRIDSGLVHDGEHAWIALPPPTVDWTDKPTANLTELREDGYIPAAIGCLPGEIEDFLDFVAHGHHHGAVPFPVAYRARHIAENLASGLDGLVPTPLHDIARFVRRQSIHLRERVRYSALGLHGDAREELIRHVAALTPLATRAEGDLVREEDIPQAIDLMHAAAVAGIGDGRHPTSRGHRMLGVIAAYCERVARPRLARRPLPEADVESLGALTP